MNEAPIVLKNVTKTFGPVRALVGVTAELRPGRVTVVTGPNGSGKSTLLALVGTLARPTSGTLVHGALGRTRAEVRGTLGWVGHDSLCYPDLTGRENIELVARLHGLDPEEAFTSARTRFGLEGFSDRPVRTYSRGQRQRIAVARALVHGPRLLLWDEPTTGLDGAATDRLVVVIQDEAKAGRFVVIVTHDREFAQRVQQDRLEMERGRVARREIAPD
jgi:heme exporter protein A